MKGDEGRRVPQPTGQLLICARITEVKPFWAAFLACKLVDLVRIATTNTTAPPRRTFRCTKSQIWGAQILPGGPGRPWVLSWFFSGSRHIHLRHSSTFCLSRSLIPLEFHDRFSSTFFTLFVLRRRQVRRRKRKRRKRRRRRGRRRKRKKGVLIIKVTFLDSCINNVVLCYLAIYLYGMWDIMPGKFCKIKLRQILIYVLKNILNN